MSKSLGSVEHARTVASIRITWYEVRYSVYDPTDRWYHKRETAQTRFDEDNVPEGFKYLGHGASRMAFLGPDGVVYKRPYGGDEWDRDHSIRNCVSEHQFYRSRWKDFRAAGVYLAPCRWFPSVSVLAMKFVPKAKPYHVRNDVYAILQKLNIWDIHDGNVWIDDRDRLVLVDYAS
jgi:hypothetical protein